MKNILLHIIFTATLIPTCLLAQPKSKPVNKDKAEQKWQQGRGSMRYRIFRSKDTLRVTEGALVTLHLAWYGKDGKVPAFDTRNQGKPSVFNTVASPYPGSLEEGLFMMHRGDSAVFELQADSMFRFTFGGKVPPEAEGLQSVLVSIKLMDTDAKQTFEEREKQRKKYEADNEERRKNETSNIERFLYLNNITQATYSSGVWHNTINHGQTAQKPQPGERVAYRMTGRLLDGTIFEGSAEQAVTKEFTIGKDPVPQGLERGIQLMNLGEKALLIIPSELAFGSAHMGKLPPYSTLLLEVELLEIKPKKP
jgi:FKBP-type peptidyl-prolyl cis-trans isomerase FkpA